MGPSRPTRPPFVILFSLAILSGPPGAASAGIMLSVTIAGTTVKADDSLMFTNKDFAGDKSGYTYKGLVEAFDNGGSDILRLIDFEVEVPAGGKGGAALGIVFQGSGFKEIKGTKVKAKTRSPAISTTSWGSTSWGPGTR